MGPVGASAQTAYPSRPVDIIVPYGPGGSTDLSTRMLAEFVKAKHQVIVNIINKPGGSGVPANLDMYKAKPDGYTLFADCTSTNITMEISIKDLPFKVMERTFVGSHSASPYIITVPVASPHKTLQDLFDDLKSKPEEFTYVSAGALANHDVIFRQAAHVLKVDPLKAKPIVVSGAAQAAVVTAQNSVKMGGGTIASQLSAIKAGTIRALAICGNQRWEDLPDVPTTAELGYSTITYDQWNGISGPPKLSSEVVKIWEGYIQEMAKDPGLVGQLKTTGARPLYRDSEQLRQQVQKTGEEMRMLWQ
jgi:tripartite-type tricarboxylate transporter receptor subunit TctC